MTTRDIPDAPSSGPPRLGKATLRLTALVLGLIASLIVVEVGLRIATNASHRLAGLLYLPTLETEFDSAKTTPELLRKGYFGYHPFGSTRGFILNSRGFRTHEYSLDKPPRTFRIIAIGDSFTFDSSSVPYGSMWHQVAGKELTDRLRRKVEVISLSQPAVGPRFELRLWELEGRPLNADLVILGFFVGNDFIDESGRPLTRRPLGYLAQRSYLWRLIRNSWLRFQADAGEPIYVPRTKDQSQRGGFEFPDYPAQYDPATPSLPEQHYLATDTARMRILAGPDESRFRDLCIDAVDVIERLARSVEVSGARLLVMIIPAEAQIDPELLERLFDNPAELALERPQQCLATELSQRRIEFVDLLPDFRRARAQGDPLLYKPRDTHWTDLGNWVAGQALTDEIVKRGLAPP